jgi:tRNA(Ile)-lysidine synthase
MTPTLPSGDLVDRFRRDLAALGGEGGTLGIAVSGGPDSLGLLLLARAAFPGAVRAATVDHGLRAESADEARRVASICRQLSCPHDILTVTVPASGEGVQGEARRARYAALARWMAASGVRALLTAHHADDQAETLLMRLMRGSGVAGLAGIRPRAPVPGSDGEAVLLRPLLGWRRDALSAIVREAGLEPVDDPSNRDEAYDRVRIRRRLAESPWLDPAAIARSAAALAEAEEALKAIARQTSVESIEEKDGAIFLRPDGVPVEILRRLVLSCLRRIVPDAAPRGDQLTALIGELSGGRSATLAGVKCSGGPRFRFEPAPPRRAGG